MKNTSLLIAIVASSLTLNAQTITPKPLKKVMTLTMPRTVDDEYPGTRGASVVWHPLQKKYYAAMAGNTQYPLGVFDAKGKLLSPESLNTDADVRGLWYNPQKKQLQGNSYDDYGWFSFKLDSKGIPQSTDIFMEGMNQPDAQSIGAYHTSLQEVLFLNAGFVSFYSFEDGLSNKSIQIQWGHTKEDGLLEEEADEAETPEDYNYTTVIYTGIKGAEIGFLNITEKHVELYNIADGFLTKKLSFPEDAPVYNNFNFAYTNGIYWLFNIETRIWTGYK
ncbi:MAG: hypothetical protein WBC06_17605 [Chitinophagaceae bacterium]